MAITHRSIDPETPACGATALRLKTLLRIARRSDGGPLVELALTMPIMMIMIVGMFGMGIMLNNYMVLTSIVGTSARNLAMVRGTTAASDPCTNAISQAISTSPSLNLAQVTWTVTWKTWDTNTATFTGTSTYTSSSAGAIPSCTARSSSIYQGDNVAVTATYPAVFYQYGLTGTSMNLTARSAELMQ